MPVIKSGPNENVNDFMVSLGKDKPSEIPNCDPASVGLHALIQTIDADETVLVCHSKGGIAAMTLLDKMADDPSLADPRISACYTIDTPYGDGQARGAGWNDSRSFDYMEDRLRVVGMNTYIALLDNTGDFFGGTAKGLRHIKVNHPDNEGFSLLDPIKKVAGKNHGVLLNDRLTAQYIQTARWASGYYQHRGPWGYADYRGETTIGSR